MRATLVRLADEEHKALAAAAQRLGVSKASVLRLLVRTYARSVRVTTSET
jgi:predicted DNA-binding protein (UPF0251 family)